jgi:hypothetical protein
MNKPVLTTPSADLQILEIDAWWRENRDKAPDLFEEELALAFRLLASSPGAGKRYQHPNAPRGIMSTTSRWTITSSSWRSGAQ